MIVAVQKNASKSGQTESHALSYKRRRGSTCVPRLLRRSVYVISNANNSGQVVMATKMLKQQSVDYT